MNGSRHVRARRNPPQKKEPAPGIATARVQGLASTRIKTVNKTTENRNKLSNRACYLAEEAREAHKRHKRASRESIDAYIQAGQALEEARGECKHGLWEQFLARAGIEERTAQRMMKLAKTGWKSDTVSDLGGITKALNYLSAMQDALRTWQEFFDRKAGDREFQIALLHLRPDGPISAAAWLRTITEGRWVSETEVLREMQARRAA